MIGDVVASSVGSRKGKKVDLAMLPGPLGFLIGPWVQLGAGSWWVHLWC